MNNSNENDNTFLNIEEIEEIEEKEETKEIEEIEEIEEKEETEEIEEIEEINEMIKEIKEIKFIQQNNYNNINRNFGFIITRHVNSKKTNYYWNINVSLINKFYPKKLIVIIDDNSNPEFVKPFHKYNNLIIVKSEFPGRGELLPYLYFTKNKWFNKAVIIHDGVFFHKRIPFENYKSPAISLWHFHQPHTKIDLNNIIQISSVLKYSKIFNYMLQYNNDWIGSFGVQSFISHDFATYITNKYKLMRLLKVVKKRGDRCALERIFGIIFYLETKVKKSIFGNIFNYNFGYSFDQYVDDVKNKKIKTSIIKVFTGR